MSGAKIVNISGVTSSKGERAKPLPVVVTKLRDAMRQRVTGLLRKLFDGADDALFAMADKAGSNGDQACYFDAMRELRLEKKHIATEVIRGLICSFNEMGDYQSRFVSKRNQAALDDLSLVQNDDLELKVAIEGMCSRSRNATGSNLEDFRLRCESLIAPRKLKPEQVPVSPEILSEHFAKGLEALSGNIRAKLVLLKLFERYVLSEMVPIYAEANALMQRSGILPDLKSQATATSGASGKNSGSSHQNRDRREGQVSENLSSDMVPTLTVTFSGQNNGDVLAITDIHKLLHPGSSASSEPPVLNMNHYQKQDLVKTLSFFQAQQIADAVNRETNKVIDFRSILNARLSKQQSVSSTFSEMDDDVINLVSMLFDFILDDHQLQPVMKMLISRLQIPILKVALMDRSFFSKGGHPARKLLNMIASSAIGWTVAPSGRPDHLRTKIENIVNRVLKDFDDRVDLFQELLDDFSTFVDKESRRGLLIEQRIKDSEHGKAVNEVARQKVQDTLNAAMKGRRVPDCVVTLLRDGWSNLMVLHYLKGGMESIEWQKDCALLTDLIWTVDPTEGDGDARARLLRMIPGVIKRTREGLNESGFDEFRTKELLARLEGEHIAALGRLKAEPVVVTETIEPEEIKKSNDQGAAEEAARLAESVAEQNEAIEELVRSTLELEEDFKRMQAQQAAEIREVATDQDQSVDQAQVEEIVLVTTDESAVSEVEIDDNDPFMQQVDKFSVGCWFEFDDQGKSERCKLAAVIKATGKFIFVNRAGVKVADKTRAGLAVELKKGSLQILNDGLLFDRALESVITSLRSKAE